MQKNSKVLIAGSSGLVGSALKRKLSALGFEKILAPTHHELDYTNAVSVQKYFELNKPEYIFLAAAKVGGIHANNTLPVDFLLDNLKIELNIIENAHKFCCKKLLFLGSSCIYPKFATQPIQESELLSGMLEPTNEPYAIAKIAGIKLCQAYNRQYSTKFISAMPTNLYGINDNYHPENSHVIPGLIRRFHFAKAENKSVVSIWGSGKPLREFLFSDDLAEACVFLMNTYESNDIINIGSGHELTISQLAHLIAQTVGFKGNIELDATKPDGTPRKLLNSSKINSLGWEAKTEMAEGLKIAYNDFLTKI